ncbi:phage tail tape measure protein, partial [Escherichia coli]|nr:phage tail tape measure protein [Escherichia coli]EFK0312851.1 phage tail tape measure protein [Escherichia coli]EFN0069630.1 phage tail tape measure protein [Escherichia coli]EFN4316244.1 phage tail tape measure protein [Escherichia coli]EFN8378366.1 phage tail tape measure protein [Escherichia coli]
QKAFDEADKKWQWYQSRSQRRGKTSSFRANLQGAWNDRENARLGRVGRKCDGQFFAG